jgi:hypothetical protein
MKLWLGNVAPDATDEEIKELVQKYAPGLSCTGIQRVEGTSRPGAMLEFSDTQAGAVEKVSQRLNGMYWKNRALVCQTVTF